MTLMTLSLIAGLGCAKGGSTAPGGKVAAIPAPPSNRHLRAEFDADPSTYVGRFFKDELGSGELDEGRAMELTCSQYIDVEIVDGGGVAYTEVYNASAEVSARFGLPPIMAEAGGSAQRAFVASYTVDKKMRHIIKDAAAFEACCMENPDQCTERFIGEFTSGTGSLFWTEGKSAKVDFQLPTGGIPADIDGYMGMDWTKAIDFPNPVYFAFKTTDNAAKPLGTGECSSVDWDTAPPRTSAGQYFVGVSKRWDSESGARDEAMTQAKVQAVKWLAEQITTGSITSERASGTGGSVTTALEKESTLETAASAMASFVKDHAWCTDHQKTPDGTSYLMKVAAFLPASEYAKAADELAGGIGGDGGWKGPEPEE